ncbi:MAG TPA: LLM class flavin-dependent oxidoreductase [Actinopolymorphaceae bacterium]
MDRTFRFGTVAGSASDAKAWTSLARRVEGLGYSSLLVPDTLWTFAPFSALAAAATATTTLFVGTHVLAAPFRTPDLVAAETDTLDTLSDGRFELGLGTGAPGGEVAAARLGLSWGTGSSRLARLTAQIAAVRDRFAGKERPTPPIMLAGTGPKLFALAAAEADTLTLAAGPLTSDEELARVVGRLQGIAGAAYDRLELATNIAVVGEELPDWLAQRMHLDLAALRAADSYTLLSGTPRQMADVLLRRRDRLGISYVTVPSFFAEEFAPVVELLAGR